MSEATTKPVCWACNGEGGGLAWFSGWEPCFTCLGTGKPLDEEENRD